MERSDQGLKFEYTDAGVASGVIYYYKLEAMDVTGNSHFVSRASATPLAVNSPSETKEQSEKELGPPSRAESEAVSEDEIIDPTPGQAAEGRGK